MFVVPCKYVKESHIKECVDSIIEYHPTEKVMIVDSFSEDDSYLDQFKDYKQVDIFDQKNNQYPVGALMKVMSSCNEDTYTLIHDCTLMKQSIQSFIDDEVEARGFWYFVDRFSWFGHQPEMSRYIIDVLEKSKYSVPDPSKEFYGVPFHHCTITNTMSKKILDSGIYENFYLENKSHDNGWERLLGIIFAQEGYPTIDNSIIGLSTKQNYNNEYVNKIFLNRQ